MKKQMMTALAVSAMMTLAMPFASFAASRSCQTGFRPGNNCGYTTDTNAISMVRTQGGCVISNGNAIGLYTVSGKGYPSWGTGICWCFGVLCAYVRRLPGRLSGGSGSWCLSCSSRMDWKNLEIQRFLL